VKQIIGRSIVFAVIQLMVSSLCWGNLEYNNLAANQQISFWMFILERSLAIYLVAAVANGVIFFLFAFVITFVPPPSVGWTMLMALLTVGLDALYSLISGYQPGIMSVLAFVVVWAAYMVVSFVQQPD